MKSLFKSLIQRYFDLDAYFLFRSNIDKFYSDKEYEVQDNLVIEEIDKSNSVLVQSLTELIKHNGNIEISVDKLLNMLNKHNRCFIARDNNSVAGMYWIAAPGSGIYRKFAAFVRNYPSSRVFYNAYVHPRYRGRQLQLRMDAMMKKILKNEGIQTTFVFVGVKNLASVLNCHICNDEYRLIYHVTIDLPLIPKINLYPKAKRENWQQCHAQEARHEERIRPA